MRVWECGSVCDCRPGNKERESQAGACGLIGQVSALRHQQRRGAAGPASRASRRLSIRWRFSVPLEQKRAGEVYGTQAPRSRTRLRQVLGTEQLTSAPQPSLSAALASRSADDNKRFCCSRWPAARKRVLAGRHLLGSIQRVSWCERASCCTSSRLLHTNHQWQFPVVAAAFLLCCWPLILLLPLSPPSIQPHDSAPSSAALTASRPFSAWSS